MSADIRSMIESAVDGSKEDMRNLLLQFMNQHILTQQVTGTSWVTPTSSTQKPSTTPPPRASVVAQGANGVISLQITNPAQAAKATIYHRISYSPVKNLSQNVTVLPTSAATTVNIPAPGQTHFIQVESSYDGVTWNTPHLVQQKAVNAGLQSSAASEPATALNNWNFANVVGKGSSGQIPVIQVYGPNGPYSGYTAGRGSTQVKRPSATILNTDFTQNQIVAFDGSRFHISPTLPPILNDSWEPVGQAIANGPVGGGGINGGNGARLTAI